MSSWQASIEVRKAAKDFVAFLNKAVTPFHGIHVLFIYLLNIYCCNTFTGVLQIQNKQIGMLQKLSISAC